MRVDYALRQHEQWYRGDGAYSDGPAFHWDYYNSFVIHPMLVDVLAAVGDAHPAWTALRGKQEARATRYAGVLERLVAPDGTFPPWAGPLPIGVARSRPWRRPRCVTPFRPRSLPAQAREALTAVIGRALDAPNTFDADGWLTIGFAGHQPGIGERYISTGSLYLCAMALLPLGLPAVRSVLGRPTAGVDRQARVGRGGLSDRSRYCRLTIAMRSRLVPPMSLWN